MLSGNFLKNIVYKKVILRLGFVNCLRHTLLGAAIIMNLLAVNDSFLCGSRNWDLSRRELSKQGSGRELGCESMMSN